LAIPFTPIVRSPGVLRFALIGLSGILVNQLALVLFTEVGGIWYALSAVMATQVSSTWNFAGIELWAFPERQSRHRPRSRFLAFLAVNNATLLLRIPMLFVFTELVGINYVASNLFSLVALFAVRYALADKWIWRAVARVEEDLDADRDQKPHLVAVGPGRAPNHEYDIAGILTIHSDVELRELRYFRTSGTGAPSIRIRTGRVGALPTRHTRFHQNGEQVTYLEQLGAASANFSITMGEPIEVRVAPLLSKSPHVLYTNVVEALLRFQLVSRGYVLLHSACMVVDGKAVLLSAQTDTGKTSTVIKLVRERGYQFLSDDMTIISPDGSAICYPKPMTLSYHTMQVVNEQDLPLRERVTLAIQSRLHSKSGRSIGSRLGRMNIPIMSINSVVQMLVPPPKYHITSLLDCVISERAPIGHVFLMERGEPLQEELDVDGVIGQLIENTDDAYGFPPFSTFAPHIRIGDADYPELRRQEEQLLRRSLSAARLWRLRVEGHEWAQLLPTLIGEASVVAIPVVPDGSTVASSDVAVAVLAPSAAAAVDALVADPELFVEETPAANVVALRVAENTSDRDAILREPR